MNKNQQIDSKNQNLIANTGKLVIYFGFGLKILAGLIRVLIVVLFLAGKPTDANNDGEINYLDATNPPKSWRVSYPQGFGAGKMIVVDTGDKIDTLYQQVIDSTRIIRISTRVEKIIPAKRRKKIIPNYSNKLKNVQKIGK